jgi:hypothetical protein
MRGQQVGQEPQVPGGQVEARRVDKHMKLLAARAILIVNPSIRSFVVCAGQPADPSTKLAVDIIAAGSA